MKVGVLGGTFDPPHLGHLELARRSLGLEPLPDETGASSMGLRTLMPLDQVLWIPNNRNPLKHEAIAEPSDRLEMVRLMIEDQPQMAVSDIELTREGPSFMVDTLTELKAAQPDWDLWAILGADSLAGFMDWHYPERILRMVRLAVAVRPGTDLSQLLETMPEMIDSRIDIMLMPPYVASSTEVRAQIAKGQPTSALHPSVASYIAEQGLYTNR